MNGQEVTSRATIYDPMFEAASKFYDLPQNLLKKMARFESNYDPEAIGPMTSMGERAVGLMQIMPSMHPDVDPTDPFESIDYAGKYIRELYDQFGSWELALAGYNAGPGTVQRFGRKPPSEWQGYDETKNYVQNILGELENIPDESMEGDIFSRMWNSDGGDKSPYHHPMPEEGGVGYRESGPDLRDLPFIGQYIEKFSEKVFGPQSREVRDVEPLGSPGMLEWLAPSRVGVNAVAGVAKLVRRVSPLRRSGVRLAGEVAKASKETARAGVSNLTRSSSGPVNRDFLGRVIPEARGVQAADDVANAVFKDGYKFWKPDLGGMNPSQIEAYTNSLSQSERLISQRGQLLSLQEHLANIGRSGKSAQAAQRNLMSPAGQARLAETFRGMPPEYLAHFNKLVETGRWQRVSHFMLLVGLAFPAARIFGRDILEFFGMGNR